MLVTATDDVRAYTSLPRGHGRWDASRRDHEIPFADLARDRPGPGTLEIRVTPASVEAGSPYRKRSFDLRKIPRILGLPPGTDTVLWKPWRSRLLGHGRDVPCPHRHHRGLF